MNRERTAKELRPGSWPMWLFVAIALLLNASLPSVIMWIEFGSFEREIQAAIFFAGVVVGEMCFVALVAGLTQRTWFGAYLFGLALTVAGYSAFLGGVWLADSVDRDTAAGLALLPVFLLAAASPLTGLRRFFGWRLVFEGDAISPWQPLRLADLFSQIAIVASVLVLARVPQVILENSVGDHWLPVAISCLVLAGTSLVILPLYARVALGGLSARRKAVRMAFLPLVIAIICFGISQCFMSRNASWSERLDAVPFLLALLVPAIGIFYLSLLLLAASGLRLVRGTKLQATPMNNADKQQAARLQRLTWWRIGGAIVVTMATSIYLANLEQWRAVRDKENAKLVAIVQATGGTMNVVDRIPINISLGATATDADFAAIVVCTKLEYLFLQGAEISDEGMRQLEHFPSLGLLSLENMRITEDGLAPLKHLTKLESLVIKNCDVNASSIRNLPQKQCFISLDLTETQFSDDECGILTEFPALRSLKLNHTRITDRSRVSLGKLTTLSRLELAGTQIGAERFPLLSELSYLDLSQTQVNDATVPSLARLFGLHFLSLSDTKITDAGLTELHQLTKLYGLDLSGNAIGDEGVAKLIPIGEIDKLSLANTAITDACLEHIGQIAIGTLDIRGTQITLNGLIANGPPSFGTLQVATGQFTSQQKKQLEVQLGIKVNTEEPWQAMPVKIRSPLRQLLGQ